ncbi:MAG: NTP transferase domain-containing protein [Candidatus Aenigmarchaeota archaeon]|nr:NTP transferase domain-containing protein [Candidatus Aenigmarchaeota archaeon]
MKAVILAAGRGTRFEPLTLTTPKPLLEVANKPVLEWNLQQLKGVANEVVIVVGYLGEKIKERIGDEYNGIRIEYAEQKEPLGTGHALESAKQFLDGRFIVLNGDDLYHKDDIEACAKRKFAVLGKEVNNARAFGVINEEGGKLLSIKEKPDQDAGLANTGLYVLDDSVFDFQLKKSSRGEYEIIDYVTHLADNGEVRAEIVKKFWQPLTYSWHLLDANALLLKEHGTQIADNAEIRSGAYIEEPVAIGAGSIVGPNCVIRKHVSIGSNCWVGSTEVKNSIIMSGTKSKHFGYIGESVVGRGCNFGGGVVVADLRLDEKNVLVRIKGEKIDSGRRKLGAIIGDSVKIGANVTIMPGKKIWPGIIVPPLMAVKEDIEKQPELKINQEE